MDHTSPYFLGSQDRPGDLITQSRLRGDNYEEWAASIRIALRALRKFGFVDGSIVTPVSPCTEDDWWTIHSMIVSWLMNTIDPEVKSTLSIFDDAKLLWDYLKERFSIANGLCIHQLKAGIAKWDQTPNMTVATYYGKLKGLWDELNNREPLLNCVCGNIGSLLKKRREEERLLQFLMGLDGGRYGQLRTTILSQDPLPSLNKAYQLITQEEQVRGYTRGSQTAGQGKGAINEVSEEMSEQNSKLTEDTTVTLEEEEQINLEANESTKTEVLDEVSDNFKETPNKSGNTNINNSSSSNNSINDTNDIKTNNTNENDNTTLASWEIVSLEWIQANIVENRIQVVTPRNLTIKYGSDPEHWLWRPWHFWPAEGNRGVAEMREVRDFWVSGVFETGKLLFGSTYEVAFVIALHSLLKGWESPTKLTLLLPNGSSQLRTANFNQMPGDQYIKVYVGEFKMSPELVGQLKFSMENDDSNLKYGLWIYMAFIEQQHFCYPNYY